MSDRTPRTMWVNLAVKNLTQSVQFFTDLGFEFDPQFTNESGACMMVGDGAYVMLLAEPFFRAFTTKDLCDTAAHTEALLALSCDSRDEVDDLVNKAIAAGGSHAMPSQDHGFMYGWSFYDLDGHHWEVFWMNPDPGVA